VLYSFSYDNAEKSLFSPGLVRLITDGQARYVNLMVVVRDGECTQTLEKKRISRSKKRLSQHSRKTIEVYSKRKQRVVLLGQRLARDSKKRDPSQKNRTKSRTNSFLTLGTSISASGYPCKTATVSTRGEKTCGTTEEAVL
jgi:hypothetical protein